MSDSWLWMGCSQGVGTCGIWDPSLKSWYKSEAWGEPSKTLSNLSGLIRVIGSKLLSSRGIGRLCWWERWDYSSACLQQRLGGNNSIGGSVLVTALGGSVWSLTKGTPVCKGCTFRWVPAGTMYAIMSEKTLQWSFETTLIRKKNM